jgi:hypothetical protein
MAQDFENDIREIARGVQQGEARPAGGTLHTDTDKLFMAAIEEFYVLSRRAVTIFNDASPGKRLSLQRLTPDFLDLFLSIPGRRGGFSISSPSKIVILFDEDPDMLTVIGKKRKTEKDGEGKLSPAVQLIKINFRKEDNALAYRDNAGGALDAGALVTLFIRWVSAP